MIEWWVWLIVAGIFLVVEIFTLTFALLACAIAAAVAALLNYLGLSLPIQWISFGLAALILFLIFKNNPRLLSPKTPQNFGSERIIGRDAVVSEDIDPLHSKGLIKIAGETWRASSDGDEIIKKGTTVTIEKIDGTKAFVVIKKEN